MTALEHELTQSIGETLARTTHANELRVSWIRAITLTIVTVFGTLLMSNTTFTLALVWCACAWGVVAAKRRGRYHAWALWVTTVLDAAALAMFTLVSAPQQPMLLAATALVCSLVAIAGAVRLEWWWVWVTTTVAMANVALSSAHNGLTFVEGLLLTVLTLTSGMLGSWLAGLSRRALQSEVHRVVLGRFLPEQVLDAGTRTPLQRLTEPRALDATVLVSDIRSFTALAEILPPAEVLEFLNDVQGTFAAIVQEHGGMVDKFMGDGMLAVFGVSPDEYDRHDHASRAIAAAHDIARAAAQRRVRIGIGVHSGRIVAGVLGSGSRLELTVIGDTVNLASRLEALTKERSVTALISDSVVDRAGDADLRRVGAVRVRGRVGEVVVYTLAA